MVQLKKHLPKPNAILKYFTRQDEEDTIVDHIIQAYAEQNTEDSNLLDLINEESREQDEKQEMLSLLDKYNTMAYEHPVFNKLKKRLFGKDKNTPMLTHIEFSVCFLANTRKYYPEAIMDILWIEKERFCQLIQSLEQKLVKGEYSLPKGYKAMQPLIHEYCITG